MLAIENLTVHAGAKTLLRNINASIPGGAFTVAVGPNGAGKSTLFKAMCGAVRYSSGDVLLENQSIRLWPAKKLALQLVSMGSRGAVGSELRVGQYVEAGGLTECVQLAATRNCTGMTHPAAMKALELAGLAHLKNERSRDLLAPDQHRLHLACVIARILEADSQRRAPKYLWMDEPAAGLDPAHQHRFMRVVREFVRRGGSVFCILQDLNLATTYADEVLVLNEGTVASQGPPDQALHPSILRRVFGVEVVPAAHPLLDRPALCVVPPQSLSQPPLF